MRSDAMSVDASPILPFSEDIGMTPALSPFRNPLAEFVYTRTYSRWIPEKGRRETWAETVDRYIAFMVGERQIPEHVVREARRAIFEQDVLPSMRALWAAGDAARRDNTCIYNCSFIPLDSLKSFSEALYILMCGTGVGFSVERQFVNNLPVVALSTGETVHYTIQDSTEGWADSLYFGLVNWFKGHTVVFDYSKVRPRGAPLATKGGRASGPEPLQRLLDFAAETISSAAGRKLKTLECHDIACLIGEIVMVGGFRRAALISFSDPDDTEMRHAKDWTRGKFPVHRYMANNSAFYETKPSEETFWAEWEALARSGSGERGFSIDNWWKWADRPRGDVRSNPCHEIGLRFFRSTDPWTGEGGGGQFCNLTAAVMRADDTRETMARKVRTATWLGCVQASFTDFPYLRPAWRQTCEEDRLLGVDITGQCDNPALSQDPEVMTYLNRVALETAAEAAAYLGINYPAAITCGKPSGNSSQFVDCASGFHARHAKHYIRRIRTDGKDPLTQLLRDSGVPLDKENGMEHLPDSEVSVWVASFPVKAPENAMVRGSETAVEMMERYLHVMRTWCGERGHNQSATIYVREHEWQEVGQWVWDHFDEITGLSFLPFDGGTYTLAPYEEITEERYESLLKDFPVIDYSLLSHYEREDRGGGATELACTSGSCEL
jgi:ribonucleoside-triphosphate reductase (thioredoxin)